MKYLLLEKEILTLKLLNQVYNIFQICYKNITQLPEIKNNNRAYIKRYVTKERGISFYFLCIFKEYSNSLKIIRYKSEINVIN